MARPITLLAWIAVVATMACDGNDPTRVPMPPTIEILEPETGDDPHETVQGDTVEFVASVTDGYDTYDQLEVVWTSEWEDEEGHWFDEQLGVSDVDPQGRSSFTTAAMEAGSHTVTATVTDSDDLEDSDFVNVVVSPANDAPMVEITAPADGAEVEEGAAVQFSAVASDDQDPSLLEVAWSSDVDGLLDDTAPSAMGALAFETDTLTPGEHVIELVVTDGDGLLGSDEVTLTVLAQNEPPSTPTVTIEPPGPQTDDDLRCIATDSVDPEGGPVEYGFAWDLDGTVTGWTGDTLSESETMNGDEWTCWATPADNEGLEGIAGSAVVVIGNTLPSYTSAVLGPTPAYEESELLCEPQGWHDPDGDPEGALFEWWVDGAVAGPVTDTLDGTYFDRDMEVVCEVTPFDGVDAGNVVTSNGVTISNSAPTEPVIALAPDPLHTDDDVECAVLTPAGDVDGDALDYQYEWYRDGALQPVLVTDTVLAGETTLGEQWRCAARADDLTDTSGWAEASAWVVPRHGDLIITEIMIDPQEVDDSDGEYVELYNASAEPIALDGFVLHDGAADSHTISSGGTAVVAPGALFVLGVESNPAYNGGAAVDYEYAGFDLDQGADAVILEYLGVEVDSVAYDWGWSFPSPSGASMILDPLLIDAVDNDDGASWCGSTTPLFAGGDFGTPGAVNDSCDCWYSDADGDGFGVDVSCPEEDCDDTDATVYPGAYEFCWDGVDQDCDGVDRECTCAESDLDGDGFGTALDCVQVDCDDTDADVFPGAVEVCNSIDDNCDGSVDEGFDVDLDGHTSCGGDCDDTDPTAFPGNPEACDGVDNDCDGILDPEDADGCDDYYADLDGDTYGSQTSACLCADAFPYTATNDGDCDDTDASVNPAAAETCNGVDDNCDGTVDDGFDVDNDGWTSCAGDCNDTLPEIYPGAPEICDDLDNDCDSHADEDMNGDGCFDYLLDVDNDAYGVDGDTQCWCDPNGDYRAIVGGDCDDAEAAINPGANETCNFIDDDCDGIVDDGYDVDADGWTTCEGDCNDNEADAYPGAMEQCDDIDNDCDGSIDEGQDAPGCITYYKDTDDDGYGVDGDSECWCDPNGDYRATMGGDCDDWDPAVHPNANEVCNFIDDDCDGDVDEGYDLDNDGYTTCDGDCDDNEVEAYPGATEVCDDIDNDCDGGIDEGQDISGCFDYLLDDDGDGYGVDGDTECWCDPTGDYRAAQGGDCDDNDAAVNPDANELCNFIDDNCDGNVDDGYDMDGDGYTTCDGDCNDAEVNAYPGAQEACDGIDNDCDGGIDEDEGATGCDDYYLDVDDDGFGVSGTEQCTCEPQGNYRAVVGGDCDDGDDQVHPNAQEICDGVDNDCGGGADEAWPNCTVDNGTPACVTGQCVIDSCDSGFYDPDDDYDTGCEAAEDQWEVHGGDDCAGAMALWAPLTDSPATQVVIAGNILYDHFNPAVDEDWYYFDLSDVGDANYDCDPFDVEIFFSANDGDQFRFEVYDTACSLWTGPGASCGNDLTEFDWEIGGECPCYNGIIDGYNQCTDNSMTMLIRVYRNVGGPDDDAYTLTIRNG
jgi:hypothetical protein